MHRRSECSGDFRRGLAGTFPSGRATPGPGPYNGRAAMLVAPEMEAYVASLTPVDPLLARAAAEGRAEGLPTVGPTLGRFLATAVRAAGARRVLEIGAANGCAALWMARSLPDDGGLFSIEIDPRRAAMARVHLEEAGFGDRAHVIVGDAARMVSKVAGPFEVVFNAGDRRQYGPLLDRLVSLLRPGGMLITADVLRPGEVVPGRADRTADGGTADVPSVPAYNRRLAADPRLVTSFLPVGDGLAVSVKLG